MKINKLEHYLGDVEPNRPLTETKFFYSENQELKAKLQAQKELTKEPQNSLKTISNQL